MNCFTVLASRSMINHLQSSCQNIFFFSIPWTNSLSLIHSIEILLISCLLRRIAAGWQQFYLLTYFYLEFQNLLNMYVHCTDQPVWWHVSVKREGLRRNSWSVVEPGEDGPIFHEQGGQFMVWCAVVLFGSTHSFPDRQEQRALVLLPIGFASTCSSVSLYCWLLVVRVVLPESGSVLNDW